jgi:glycosyltransferase involved in cell wall biosynthesis
MVVSPPLAGPPQALFVSYTSVLGGAELIMLDRVRALPGPVAVACPEGPLAERARSLGAQVTTLRPRRVELRGSARDRIASPMRVGAQAVELRRIVSRLRPGVVVASGMRVLLSLAPALAGLRPRRPLLFAHNDLLPSPVVGRAVRAAAGRADRVVALSEAIAADLDPRHGLGARLEVLHPGVDLERFAPTPLPGGDPEVLVLGALVEWKRPDLALEAVALASDRLPALRLRLAGEPLAASGHALRARLERRAALPDLAGRVELAGRVADQPAALARATCVLHCAEREPFGLALAEALACGRPVVAPGDGGPTEIVDSSCGALYEPGDPAAAAGAVVEVIARAPELAGPARERAERLFDVRESSARFARLVEDLGG